MRIALLSLFSALALLATPAFSQTGTVVIPSVGPGGVVTLPAEPELRRTCWIADVAAFANRVHVRCAPAVHSGLYTREYQPPPEERFAYFAVGAASDPALADRVVALATSASQQNKQVQIIFRTDPAENPPGCLPSDCRRLIGIVLLVR